MKVKYDESTNEWIELPPDSDDGMYIDGKLKEKLDSWCKENRFRLLSDMTISKHMKDKGIETFKKSMDWIDTTYNQEKPRYWVWGGIKWKN